MTLMGVMAEKGLLRQKRRGRAFVYDAKVTKVKARSGMLKDLLSRAFDGSASALVMNLLEQAEPSGEELEQIERLLEAFKKQKGDS
jgi:predicted transcriptional regulator